MPLSPPAGGGMMDRRSFLRKLLSSLALSGGVLGGFFRILPAWGQAKEEPAGRRWGFGGSGGKWIGRAGCAQGRARGAMNSAPSPGPPRADGHRRRHRYRRLHRQRRRQDDGGDGEVR